MAIAWSKELEIGDETIDMQHKDLIEKFNAFMSACTAEQGQEELESSLDFLCEYTVKHFTDEEALQRRINYPEYKKHKQLHDEFQVRVANLADLFKQKGPSDAIVARISTDVGEWLITHVKWEDTKLASYLKKDENVQGIKCSGDSKKTCRLFFMIVWANEFIGRFLQPKCRK